MRIYFRRPKRDKYGLGSAAGSVFDQLSLQESSAGKNTRKKFSSRIYLRAGQFKARKKFSSLM